MAKTLLTFTAFGMTVHCTNLAMGHNVIYSQNDRFILLTYRIQYFLSSGLYAARTTPYRSRLENR